LQSNLRTTQNSLQDQTKLLRHLSYYRQGYVTYLGDNVSFREIVETEKSHLFPKLILRIKSHFSIIDDYADNIPFEEIIFSFDSNFFGLVSITIILNLVSRGREILLLLVLLLRLIKLALQKVIYLFIVIMISSLIVVDRQPDLQKIVLLNTEKHKLNLFVICIINPYFYLDQKSSFFKSEIEVLILIRKVLFERISPFLV
jgi:hypothetical protein